MKLFFISLIVFLSFCVNAQKVFTETFQFKGKRYATVVLKDSFTNRKESQIKLDRRIIQPIEKSDAIFEVRCYLPMYGLNSGSHTVIIYKVVNDKFYASYYSSTSSMYRLQNIYPDSLGIDEYGQILQRKIMPAELTDSSAKKIISELLDLYMPAMTDQTTYIDSVRKIFNNIIHPCLGTTDCQDCLFFYEMKINDKIRKFNRVGLDYYMQNKQLRELENNPKLIKTFYKIIDFLKY
jgi:hypothetical protein